MSDRRAPWVVGDPILYCVLEGPLACSRCGEENLGSHAKVGGRQIRVDYCKVCREVRGIEVDRTDPVVGRVIVLFRKVRPKSSRSGRRKSVKGKCDGESAGGISEAGCGSDGS